MFRFQRSFRWKIQYTCSWSPVIFALLITIPIAVLICRDIPLSPVFSHFHPNKHELLGQVSASNNMRLEKATRYFESLKPEDSMKFYNKEFGSQVDVVISIVTVKRNTDKHSSNLGYLTQTAAALDRIVKSTNAYSSVRMFVCNTDLNGPDHIEAGNVASYIPMVTKHLQKSSEEQTEVGARLKEAEDYIYCLHQAKLMKPRFILMVEDDSLPKENFLEVIKLSLKQIGERKFAYLKLFYPLKWQGFACETWRLVELVCFGVVGGSILLCIQCYCRPRKSHSKYSQRFQFTVGMLYTILIVYLVGRQNVMTFRTVSPHLYSLRPSPACCTPAMLFPMESVSGLISYLNGSHQLESPVNLDLKIYEFTQTFNKPGYQIEPNIFQHIGMVSSLSANIKEPEEFL